MRLDVEVALVDVEMVDLSQSAPNSTSPPQTSTKPKEPPPLVRSIIVLALISAVVSFPFPGRSPGGTAETVCRSPRRARKVCKAFESKPSILK